MDREAEVEKLFACYTRGQSLRTPSPVILKKSRKCMASPDFERAQLPYLFQNMVPSPVTPREGKVAEQEQVLATTAASASAVGRGRSHIQVSPGVFYGSPVGKPATTPLQLQRLRKQIRCEQRQGRAPTTWTTFPRQDQAILFASSHESNIIAVFVFQDHVTGQRRFLATSIDEFWQRYDSMPPALRHHYELIREGLPCHLYFDLEYSRKANPDANGEAMVDLLLLVVEDALQDHFSLKREFVVELDSSTEEKFSRHLIVRAPRAFKDNSHVGAFVRHICSTIEKARDNSSRFDALFVLKGDSRADHRAELFVDKAVYSRNRSFRLPFSSKAGKSATLQPTKRFGLEKMTTEEIFMQSLIICRPDEDSKQVLEFATEGTSKLSDRGGTESMFSQHKIGAFHISGKSPFPDVDGMVETIASVDNVPGSIRSWYWFSEYGVVVYNISGNRYCENIGRQHKSNNVMYIVDFRTAGYYQKCHDPDCRGYRSPLRPIPRHIIPPEFPLSTARLSQGLSVAAYPCCGSTAESVVQTLDVERQEAAQSEDESWWDAVISSMASIEFTSQPVEDRNQDGGGSPECDEGWWLAVETLAADLEEKIQKTSPSASVVVNEYSLAGG